MEFIYSRRLKSQYFGAPKSGAPKMRCLLAVAGIAGGVSTPLTDRANRPLSFGFWLTAYTIFYKLFVLTLNLPCCLVLWTRVFCWQKSKDPLHDVCSRAAFEFESYAVLPKVMFSTKQYNFSIYLFLCPLQGLM